jgi:hypothetical protein
MLTLLHRLSFPPMMVTHHTQRIYNPAETPRLRALACRPTTLRSLSYRAVLAAAIGVFILLVPAPLIKISTTPSFPQPLSLLTGFEITSLYFHPHPSRSFVSSASPSPPHSALSCCGVNSCRSRLSGAVRSRPRSRLALWPSSTRSWSLPSSRNCLRPLPPSLSPSPSVVSCPISTPPLGHNEPWSTSHLF